MLRVVFAVVVSTALLGASLPAIDDAREVSARSQIRGQLEQLDRAAQTLIDRNDVPPPGIAGPRRTVTLALPERTWGSSGTSWVRIPGVDGSRLTWRLGGGSTGRFRPSAPLTGENGGLTIRGEGRTRLSLTLRRIDSEPVVVVSRPDFISEGRTSLVHAATSDRDFGATLRVRGESV